MTLKFKYIVLINGGHGSDAWAKEVVIEATDMRQAAELATDGADEIGGWVVKIEKD